MTARLEAYYMMTAKTYRMDKMGEWTSEAERAILLCEEWATDVVKETKCQLFLFGSAIYKGGEQFDSTYSDLDIVCLLPEATDALSRLTAMKILRGYKQKLELDMVPRLERQTCTEPGVSIVPITPLELRANIHKSGAPRFFDKNFFYDLVSKRETLGIPSAGSRVMRDERRQALEYVQKVRNEFLSVCANGTGGLKQYDGADPLPKALLRSAAQLVPDVAEGEWYDTRLGLELMHSMLRDRRTVDKQFTELFDKVSVRRGGRGLRAGLSANDQLLLAEMLFDEGATASTEEAVTWDIRVSGNALNDEHVKEVFASISRIVPDAKLIGHRHGSIILRIRSSITGFELLKELLALNVLPKMLHVDDVSLTRVDGVDSQPGFSDSRETKLLGRISKWNPRQLITWREEEEDFASYLSEVLASDQNLNDVQVLRNVHLDGVEVPFEMDFLLSWMASDGTRERIGIDVVRLRSASTFFHKVSQLLTLGQPVILVVLGDGELVERLHDDIARLAQLNANVRVVTIRTQTESHLASGERESIRAE